MTESDGAGTEQTGEQSESETISFDPGRYHDQILILLTAAAEFVLFLPLLLRYRRLYRRSRLGGWSAGKYLSGCSGGCSRKDIWMVIPEMGRIL